MSLLSRMTRTVYPMCSIARRSIATDVKHVSRQMSKPNPFKEMVHGLAIVGAIGSVFVSGVTAVNIHYGVVKGPSFLIFLRPEKTSFTNGGN